MSSGAMGLCLVEPSAFGFNAETARTNRFQHLDPSMAAHTAATAARAEFAALVAQLREADIPLAIAIDSAQPPKPDAVFPNNWVSFHDEGTLVLYPMHDATRRIERREEVLDAVKQQLGFIERRRVDLSEAEHQGSFLEGTGSLVLDRRNKVAYACRSPRTDEVLLRKWCGLLGYTMFVFDAATEDAVPVYHTNVVMWLGANIAGVGLDWIEPSQRTALLERLHASGHEVLVLAPTQLRRFAGNMLEVQAPDGERRLVMSASAAASLDAGQHRQLAQAGVRPIVADIPVIERLGGGSVRCMMAEVPLAA